MYDYYELKCKTRGKEEWYYGFCVVDNGKIILRKGSIIRQYESKNLPKKIREKRNGLPIDENRKLTENIEVESFKEAGIFVCGADSRYFKWTRYLPMNLYEY